MKNSKVAFSLICAYCILLPYRLCSYLRNIQVTVQVGNSSFHAGKPVTLSVRGIVQLENENLDFDYQKMSTDDANRCCSYWHIRGGPFFPGLPQGAIFTHILCNSLFRLCALSDISAYLTRIWKWRLHEYVLVVILLGRPWLLDEIISVP